MGAIGGMLGLSGGASGTGFAPPQQANIQSGVTQDDLGYNNAKLQQGLTGQDELINALQKQNGLGNQSQVYNQLQGVVNGTGPNPAQAMLNQQTGQNVAQTGALMAGQRGAGQNVGLLARQAGQQGANIQQQAVGQGAAMQANQSLNALGAAGQIAGNQVANQIGQTNAYEQARQAQQGNLLNALGQQNQANVSSQSSVNAANAGLAQTGMQGQQGLVGGIMNAAGAATHLFASGGSVTGYADGGPVGPQSPFGHFLTSVSAPGAASMAASMAPTAPAQPFVKKGGTGKAGSESSAPIGGTPTTGYNPSTGNTGSYVGGFQPEARGGLVDVVLSPGEKVVAPKDVKEAAGGKVKAKTVLGKAEVKGDSLKNDKVPAKLPAGTIVVPRTKANSDPSGFVKDVLAKRGRGK